MILLLYDDTTIARVLGVRGARYAFSLHLVLEKRVIGMALWSQADAQGLQYWFTREDVDLLR